MNLKYINSTPTSMVNGPPIHVVDFTRQPRDVTLAGRTYSQDSREATLEIPRGETIDCRRAWLEFTLKLNTTLPGPTHLRASNGIWNMLRRVELKEGDRLIQTIDHYNLLQSVMYKFGGLRENEDTLGPMWGIGTKAQRNVWGALAGGRNYALPINLHSLVKAPIDTFDPIHHARLRLKLIFDDPSRWVETEAGFVPTFTVDNLRINYDVIFTPAQYKNGKTAAHQRQGITTVFDDFMIFEQQFDGATVNLQLTPNKQSIKSIFTVFINDGDRNKVDVDDKFETFKFLDIQSYQHKFGNTFFQEKPVVTNKFLPIEPYQEYLKMWGHLVGSGEFGEVTKVGIEAFKDGDCFIIAQDLETAYSDPEFLNNLSLDAENDGTVEIQLASAPATAHVGMTFIHYQGVWQHGGTHNSIVIS